MGTPLILFGAGASYGSDTHNVPPLGSDLFKALQIYSPKVWGQIPPGEAEGFKVDFEQGMKAYAEAHSSDGTVDQLQRAMAAYFFSFHPGCSNLYIRLARRIRACNWAGALASLNYERLLELAIRNTGTNVHIGGPPESGGSVELCLPHGCCHLFGQIRSEGNVIFGRGIRLDSPEIRIVEDQQEHARELTQSAVPPIMSYFQPDKQTRSGVSFINSQRGRFTALVGSASAVAIVGVKVRPHDRHLWNPLAQTAARLVYCAGKSAAMEFESWAEGQGRSGDLAIPAFWRNGFDEVCKALLLPP